MISAHQDSPGFTDSNDGLKHFGTIRKHPVVSNMVRSASPCISCIQRKREREREGGREGGSEGARERGRYAKKHGTRTNCPIVATIAGNPVACENHSPTNTHVFRNFSDLRNHQESWIMVLKASFTSIPHQISKGFQGDSHLSDTFNISGWRFPYQPLWCNHGSMPK